MQLIYTSEFTLMPLVFLLFYVCSNSYCKSNSTSASNELNVNIIRKEGCLARISEFFYDGELSKSNNSRQLFLNMNGSSNTGHAVKTKSSRSRTQYPRHLQTKRLNGGIGNSSSNSKLAGFNKIMISNHDLQANLNEALLSVNKGAVLSNNNHNISSNNFPHHFVNKLNVSQRKLSSSSLAKVPTPFELAANNEFLNSNNNAVNNSNNSNLVHVIQHPSWRINIKQQPNSNNNTNYNNVNTTNNINTSEQESSSHGLNGASVQLPFSYVKTSSYKS
jgi:hypothetical protein